MKLFAPIFTLLAVATVGASAAAEPVVAKLQAPVSNPSKPVAGNAVFECLGDVCAARSPTEDTASARACKQLARQVGPVVSFGAAAKPLAPTQITECNDSARK